MAFPAHVAGDGVTPPQEPSVDDRCPHCGARVDDAWLTCAACGEPVAAPAELPSGTRLCHDRFEVLRVLGRGGFGITYEVMDHRLERRVAIKELFPDAAVRHGSLVLTPPHARVAFRDARGRFLREARVLARFTHSGIVRVYEVFEEHNTAYLVMELLEGRTLLDILNTRGRPFREDEVLDVAGRSAVALRSVHAAGVLHRDINPANIVLTDHGRIVVIDFGIARSFVADASSPMTAVVTPGYAPIEQYIGDGRFGPASDVYGLAATLYRLATGRVPVAALEREGGRPLPSPHSLNPAISKGVSDGILDGLEINPSHRPQTLDAFLLRLGVRVSDPRPARSLLLDSAPAAVPPASPPAATAAAAPVPVPGSGVLRPLPRPPDGRDEDVTVLEQAVHRGADATVIEAHQGRPAEAPGDDATVIVGAAIVGAAPGGDDATVPPATTVVAHPAPPPVRHADPGSVAIGPHPSGRWKATVPLAAIALAVGAAAPVVAVLLLVLVVLPVLATWGDSVVHHFRRQSGTAQGWLERSTPPAAAAPVRFVGNLVVSALRSLPIVALTGVLLGLWYGLDHLDLPDVVPDTVLRVIGVLATAVLAIPARAGSARFRTGVAVDDAVSRLVTPAGRLGQRGAVLWIVAAAAVAGSLWLTPDVWPLPH